MTKDRAIQVLRKMKSLTYFATDSRCSAIDMAIKSLQADTVSRSQYQGLLNAIGKVYVEVVRCKDCRHWSKDEDMMLSCDDEKIYGWCDAPFDNDDIFINGDYATRMFTSHDFFCKSGEWKEEVNGFKSVGQAWNTSQERRYP